MPFSVLFVPFVVKKGILTTKITKDHEVICDVLLSIEGVIFKSRCPISAAYTADVLRFTENGMCIWTANVFIRGA